MFSPLGEDSNPYAQAPTARPVKTGLYSRTNRKNINVFKKSSPPMLTHQRQTSVQTPAPRGKKEMIKISNFINYKSLSLRYGIKKVSVRPMGLEPISPAPSAANMICQQVGTIARRPHDHDYTHAPSWIKKLIEHYVEKLQYLLKTHDYAHAPSGKIYLLKK